MRILLKMRIPLKMRKIKPVFVCGNYYKLISPIDNERDYYYNNDVQSRDFPLRNHSIRVFTVPKGFLPLGIFLFSGRFS